MATPEFRRGRNQPPPTPIEFTPAQRHPFITVLLIIGGLLAIMAHLTAVTLVAHWQKWAWLLGGIGVLCFLWGMRLTLRPRRFPPFVRLLWRLSHFFYLADWQLILLAMSPLYAGLARLAGGDQLTAFHPVIAPVAWVLALTGLVLGSYRWWQPVPFLSGELRGTQRNSEELKTRNSKVETQFGRLFPQGSSVLQRESCHRFLRDHRGFPLIRPL